MINTSLFALFGRYKGDASLAGVLENIQRGTYKQFIDETREALASGDKERAAKLKKKLPAFTPQATYSGKRLDPHITRYNQLVVLDIDHVGERELERITPPTPWRISAVPAATGRNSSPTPPRTRPPRRVITGGSTRP